MINNSVRHGCLLLLGAWTPIANWTDGDGGRVLLLGSFSASFGDPAVRDRSAHIYVAEDGRCINADDPKGLEEVADGVMADCGAATMVDGRVVTSPIPRFTWVGVRK